MNALFWLLILYYAGGSPTTMDITDSHGNRYILVVTLRPSHRQNSTNRLYLPMNITLYLWTSTKLIEKLVKMSLSLVIFLSYFYTN